MIKELLDPNSSVSSVRAMAFWSLLTGSIVAIVGLLRGSDLTGLSVLVGVFVGGAFGGKVWQKKIEEEHDAGPKA